MSKFSTLHREYNESSEVHRR